METWFQRVKRLDSGWPYKDPLGRTPEDLERLAKERLEREHLAKERLRLEQENPKFVITMMHGTFAKKATWIEPESFFAQMLRERLAPAHIQPFRWSGSNSVKARAQASVELSSHLRTLLARYPAAQHAVIAHSHGGNVALTALADEELSAKMLGVVTLGTPFLSAKTSSQHNLLGGAEAFAAAVFSGVGVFALGAALGHGRGWWLAGLLTFLAIAVILAAAGYAADLMKSHARSVCEAIPSTSLKPAQLAIIRTSADEAAATLSGARVAGVLAALVWNVLSSRVVRYLEEVLESIDYFGVRALEQRFSEIRSSKISVLFGEGATSTQSTSLPSSWKRDSHSQLWQIVLTHAPFLVFALLDGDSAPERWAGAALAVGYGVPAILALLVVIASVPFGIVFALGLLPCGWTLPLAGTYLDVTAEPTPPGTWSVTQLRTDVRGEALSHSKAHDDDHVWQEASAWLSSRAEEAARQSHSGDNRLLSA